MVVTRPPPPVCATGSDAVALVTVLDAWAVGRYASALLDHGYSLSNLHLLTDADLKKLRITNKVDTRTLLYLAAQAAASQAPAEPTDDAITAAPTTAPDGLARTLNPTPPSTSPPTARRTATTTAADTTSGPIRGGTNSASTLTAAAGVAVGGGGTTVLSAAAPTSKRRNVSPPSRLYTATAPTANEWCRQATTFLEHHRVDRPWPRVASQLARSLALSTAEPDTGASPVAYTVNIPAPVPPPHAPRPAARSPDRPARLSAAVGDSSEAPATARPAAPPELLVSPRGGAGRKRPTNCGGGWRPTLRAANGGFGPPPPVRDPTSFFQPAAARAGSPPHAENVNRVKAGFQSHTAKFCPVCEERLDSTMSEGQWQYQREKKVTIGDGESQSVFVWIAFDSLPSMQLEHGRRHGVKVVHRVGPHSADLVRMRWGPHALRRVATVGIPFPTLRHKDIELAPPHDAAADARLQEELRKTFHRLIFSEEEKARFYLAHVEKIALDEVLAEIADMMEELFAAQRAALEVEENEAREVVFDEHYAIGVDELWARAEREANEVRYTDATRAGDNVVYQQQTLVSRMEELGRDDILLQERAARRNLDKLLGKYNSQIRIILREKPQAAMVDTTLRCPVCNRKECDFYHEPWRGHWRHRGLEVPPAEQLQRLDRSASRGGSTRGHGEAEDDASTVSSATQRGGAQDESRYPGRHESPVDRGSRRRMQAGANAKRVQAEVASSSLGFGTIAGLWQRAKETEFDDYVKAKRRDDLFARLLQPHRAAARRRQRQLSAGRGSQSPRLTDSGAAGAPSAADARGASPPAAAVSGSPSVARRAPLESGGAPAAAPPAAASIKLQHLPRPPSATPARPATAPGRRASSTTPDKKRRPFR